MFVEIHKQQAVSLANLRYYLDIYRGERKGIKYNLTKDDEVIVRCFASKLNLDDFSVKEIQRAIEATKKETGVESKQLFLPIRLVTTKQEHGPELASAIFLFGREKIAKRLKPYLRGD